MSTSACPHLRLRHASRLCVLAVVLCALAAPAARAQDVAGVLVADETWSAAAGPYVITGDVEVPADVTLTLEPGVEIEFRGGSLRVRGRLAALGTSGAPI